MSRPRLKVTGTVRYRFSNSPITRIRGGSSAGAYRDLSLSGTAMHASDHAEIPLNAVDRHVGARLKSRRVFLQMSEDWLAGRLNISVQELLDIEAGELRITFTQMEQAVEALNVAERYFYHGFGGSDEEPPSRPSWLRDVDRWFAAKLFPYERALVGIAHRLTGNIETARELVQDSYADMIKGDRWRDIENPRAYAMTAVRHLATRFLQRARIVPFETYADMDSIAGQDLAPDAYQVLSVKERTSIILEAIAQLPPQCRRVVELRRLNDMLPRDIASEMGISLSMVEKHLARGMAIIADKLSALDDDAGSDSDAGDRAGRGK